jgi:hypothetical protein
MNSSLVPESPAGSSPPPGRCARFGRRLLRWLVLLLLAVLAAGLLGLGTTANGRATARAAVRWLSEQIHRESLAAAEREAAESLRRRGALVLADMPDGHVRSISFMGKPLDEEALQHLAALNWVQSVDVSRTNITDEQIRYLEGLGYLASLTASATQLTDQGMEHVGRLATLESLVITGTNIGDEGLRRIARLRNLATLDLCKTRVTDAGVACLVGLPRLALLVLEDDDVSDAAIGHLEKMSSLRQVELGGTRVTAEGRARLERTLAGFRQ